jgi:hypothetical protein
MSHRATALLFVLLLTALLPAQVVQLANRTNVPFDGWVRCVCDPVPPHRVGTAQASDGQTVAYMVGRPTGRVSRAIDLKVRLAPGQRMKLDLAASKGNERKEKPVKTPMDSGTSPTIGGGQFALISVTPDGAGWSAEWRARIGATLVVKLWLHENTGEPWARGEVAWWSSNPSSPTMAESPPAAFGLGFGGAQVLVAGLATPEQSLAQPDDWYADGQGRILPVTFYWPSQQADTASEQQSLAALHSFGIGAVGVMTLWPGIGNPLLPTDLEPQEWTNARMPESVRRLHTFEAAVVGPNKHSDDSGRQEDQVFKRGEPMLANGAGAEWVAVLAAYKMAARPCHHYELDGSPIDVKNHGDLAYWDGRPYGHSPAGNMLGKPRGLSIEEAHGWWGPDVEHNLNNTLAAACRLVDSQASQELLRHQALIYLATYRVEKSDLPYLSMPFASRATCWEGLLIYHCWHHLADRDLAQRVFDRAKERISKVIVPAYKGIPGDVWDWRRDDRIGPGIRYIPWQEACGAYGLDVMAELVGNDAGREIALRAALAMLRDAYLKVGDEWTTRDVVPQDGTVEHYIGAYDWFGMPLAVATVLRHDPKHAQARSIWNQLRQTAVTVTDYSWLAPGIKP